MKTAPAIGVKKDANTESPLYMLYEDNDKVITLTFKTIKPELLISEKFVKKMYNADIIRPFIQYLFQGHLDFRSKLEKQKDLI